MFGKGEDKIKDRQTFDALRRKGYSKGRALKISNKGAEKRALGKPDETGSRSRDTLE